MDGWDGKELHPHYKVLSSNTDKKPENEGGLHTFIEENKNIIVYKLEGETPDVECKEIKQEIMLEDL